MLLAPYPPEGYPEEGWPRPASVLLEEDVPIQGS